MAQEVKTIQGRGIAPGQGEGQVLVSRQPFMFAHGVDPSSGTVIDVRSDLYDKNIRDKIIIFPYGKGSTTGSAWFLETIRRGNGPAGIVNVETEPIIATALAIARLVYGISIPLVDRLEDNIGIFVTDGAHVRVDGTAGKVHILR